ncbi:MAG: SDR family NAD(P)-dependent oxidoreductase [Flavipsychrobacter sp.]|nr:SDR family NAD(P)-dependent oxidoreductase [Flavipsychrobacter sp.]
MQLSNNKILITGGASGIGLGLTERFIQEGNTVIICGRRETALKEVSDKHPAVITYVCDLAVEADRLALHEWIAKEHSDLNVLVNNAGIQQWMDLSSADFFERAKNELVTNIEAPLHLMSLFQNLKSLKTIMNVTSGLAFAPLTKVPVYSATKAFFHSFTLSARYLLKIKGIEVIEIIPPALNTDLGGKGLHDSAPPVSEFIAAIFEQLKDGQTEVSYGFSDAMRKASADDIKAAFNRMNP